MFAVEHPLNLPLAEREQEHTYGGVYSWNNTKRIKEFTTESQGYRESSIKDYRKVAEFAKSAKKEKNKNII